MIPDEETLVERVMALHPDVRKAIFARVLAADSLDEASQLLMEWAERPPLN